MIKTVSALFLGLLLCSACTDRPAGSGSSLSPDQRKLITKAADALLLLPDMPHERNRNRELGTLVELLIASNDLQRAEHYRKQLTNWRAAQLEVSAATKYVQSGNSERAEELVAEVESIANTVIGMKAGTIVATGEHADYLERYDDYRLDRIKVALAAYYWAKGDKASAKQWSENVLPAEQAPFIKMQAEALAEDDYEGALAINETLARGETFEGKKLAIDGMVQLFGLYYAEEQKRQALRTLIDELSPPMPVMFRIEWLHHMAIAAFGQGDEEAAEQFYHEASVLIANSEFRPKLFFPMKASNIITAYRLNYQDDALEAAGLLFEKYKESEQRIVDINRADALCPIGEAYAYMKQEDSAEQVYLYALDQAVINPNSRPRLEDLNLIVISLIEYDVSLTPGLHEKIDGLVSSLGSPW